LSQSASQNPFLIFIVILTLIVVFRIRRVIYGTRVSVARAILYSIYYVGFASLFVTFSYFEGVSESYFPFYALTFAIAIVLAYTLTATRLNFWRQSDGTIYSKGGLMIYLIYVVGLIARIAIGFIFIGPSAFTFSYPPSVTLSQTGVDATIFTDLLLVFGAGMLFGRNMQMLRRYFSIKNGKEQLPQQEYARGNQDTSMPT
jgi:hypothetical protein